MSEGLRYQETLQHYLLRWMTKNPIKTRYTSIPAMAKSTDHTQGTFQSRQQTLQRMIRNQVISRFGTRRRANYYINWLHKDIPSDVLALAPSDKREEVERVKSGLKPNQHLDDVGAIVTPAKKVASKQKPLSSSKEVTKIPVEDKQIDAETIAKAPIQVAKDNNGNLSISININLNLK